MTTGSRSTFNTVTSYIDSSFVYGSSEETSNKLRTYRGGLLKSNPALRSLGLKDLLPAKTDNPDGGCKRPSRDLFCFVAGDSRVNQQVMLVALHTVFLREHNRIAVELGQINPHWSDERIYQVLIWFFPSNWEWINTKIWRIKQETRHIIAAYVQHFTYNEFLPMVLGKEIMSEYGLLLDRDVNEWFKFNPLSLIILFWFQNRVWHHFTTRIWTLLCPSPSSQPLTDLATRSYLPPLNNGVSLTNTFVSQSPTSHFNCPVMDNISITASRRLSELLNRPFDLYQGGVTDRYLSGFMNQVSQAVDDAMTEEV